MALRDSDSAIRDRQLDCHLHPRRHMTSLVLKNANRHQSPIPTWELWVNGNVSAYLFNGFGMTEADTDSCTPKWDREWTVTCTWNDMWRSQYSRMLISTNHCFQLENFELRGATALNCSMVLDEPRLTLTLAPEIWTENGLSLAPEISLIDHRLPTYDL